MLEGLCANSSCTSKITVGAVTTEVGSLKLHDKVIIVITVDSEAKAVIRII